MRKQFIDQMLKEVIVDVPPQRIVSLVPSITELVCYLDRIDELVGITKFCVKPKETLNDKERIGGTKTLHLDQIKSLSPDLIIANKEENEQHQIEELSKSHPTWVSDVNTLNEALEMILALGEVLDNTKGSVQLASEIQQKFDRLRSFSGNIRSAYFIWNKPYMVAGNSTFVNDLMQRAGFTNIFSNLERYPNINESDIVKKSPKVIFLSSEPYPFKEEHRAQFMKLCPEAKVLLVDGEMFSWYGSRLLEAPDYFLKLYSELQASQEHRN